MNLIDESLLDKILDENIERVIKMRNKMSQEEFNNFCQEGKNYTTLDTLPILIDYLSVSKDEKLKTLAVNILDSVR